MFLSTVVTCPICVIDYLRVPVIIILNFIALRPVMCSFMLICQCCFAIIKVLLKKVTYLLTYCTFTTNKARAPKPPQEIAEVAY